MNYIFLFTLELAIFALLFTFFSLPFAKNRLKSVGFYKFSLVLVLVVQIISAGIMKFEVGDVFLFSDAGHFLRQGLDIYYFDANHTHFPFFPFLIFLHAPLNFITETLKIFTYSFYLKLVLLIPLYGISYLIYTENKKESVSYARSLQLQFLTAPVTYAVVLFHGQIDILLIGFYILAGVLVLQKDQRLKNIILSSALFASSIAVKTWSTFLLPIVLLNVKTFRNRFVYVIAIGAFLFMDVFVYTRLVHSAFRTVLPALLSAGGGIAYWGYSYIIHLTPFYGQYASLNNILVFAPTFIILESYILFKKFPFWKSSFLTILVMYVLLTRWGIQYVVWIYPFMYIVQKFISVRERFIFIALTSVYVLLNYWNVIGNQKIIDNRYIWLYGFVLWLFLVYWLISLVRKWSKAQKTS